MTGFQLTEKKSVSIPRFTNIFRQNQTLKKRKQNLRKPNIQSGSSGDRHARAGNVTFRKLSIINLRTFSDKKGRTFFDRLTPGTGIHLHNPMGFALQACHNAGLYRESLDISFDISWPDFRGVALYTANKQAFSVLAFGPIFGHMARTS